MKKLVIVKSVRLHPSRENKYLAGREVVKKKRSFYGQDNCKGCPRPLLLRSAFRDFFVCAFDLRLLLWVF